MDRVAKSDLNCTEQYFATKNQHLWTWKRNIGVYPEEGGEDVHDEHVSVRHLVRNHQS